MKKSPDNKEDDSYKMDRSANQRLQQYLMDLADKGDRDSIFERDLILKALQSGVQVESILDRPDIGQRRGEFTYKGHRIVWVTSMSSSFEKTDVSVFKDGEDTPVYEDCFELEELFANSFNRALPASAESAVDMARCWIMMHQGSLSGGLFGRNLFDMDENDDV